MKLISLSLVNTVLLLSSLSTTSVSALGFTNIFAYVHNKSDEEVGLLKELMEDSEFTAKRLFLSPRRNRDGGKRRTTATAKQRRTQHKYMPNMEVTQSFFSSDEELIERLVELQN
jgi:hypothetical protein